MKTRSLIIAALCLTLTACCTDTTPAQQPTEQATEQPAPVVLSPPAEHGTLMNDLAYEITAGDYSASQYQERGYHLDVIDGKYRYTICSGERSTGGYGIKIKGLDCLDCGTVIVTVEETTPAPDMTVTEAFTYPNCAITFSYEPPDGILIQTADGIAFEDLGTTTEP